MREMVGLGSEMSSSGAADSRKANRHMRRKSLSASASIQMMRDVKSLSVPLKQELPDAPLKTKDDLDVSLDDRAKRRANRRKTISASADIRMMRMGSHRDVLKADSVPNETGGNVEGAPTDVRRVSFSESNSSSSLVASPHQQLRKSFSVSGQQSLTKISEFESPRTHPFFADRFEASPGASRCPPDRIHNEADSSTSVSDSRLSIREVLAGHNSNLIIENVKMPTLGDEAVTEADSDDEHSDVDDLPEVQESDKQRKAEPLPPKRTLLDIARAYFRGRSYILVSSLLGTMVCFFIVGMRLEAMLIETGVLVNNDNTWHLEAQVSFWVEFGLLTCFIFGDFVILYIFRPGRMFDNRDRRVFVSTIIDLSICVTCIGCLTGAQVQRCCDDAEKRFLGGSETPDGYYGYEQPIACCPPFGERLYGGYGSIEMFTSLVGLRVVRFFAAKICVQRFYKNSSLPETATTSAEGDSPPIEYPFDPFYEVRVKGQSKHRARLDDETGTIVELWKSALALHPDIVAKHGEFSGQLLQAMLGIPVICDDTAGSTEAIKDSKTDDAVDGVDQEHLGESKSISRERLESGDTPISRRRLGSGDMSMSMRRLGSGDVDEPQALSRPSIISDRRYSSLSAAAQSVILAGKLGKAVRAKHEGENGHSLGSLLEETETSNAEGGISASSNARRAAFHKERPTLHHYGESQTDLGWTAQLAQTPEFEIRTDDDDDESASQFFAPNSRLIRSMRRCDRKVMPMLDRWTVVDVVMTNFEIVYFDASDVDDLGGSANPRIKRMQDIRQAIIATKGGKGLRLRDVAFGRRVVGTQVLNDIESIHVDRILPHMHRHDSVGAAAREPLADEFWKEKVHQSAASEENMPEDVKPSRHIRWTSIKEDRLKVKTKHDTTLYLRFYSDLDNCESHQERMMNELETEGDLFKNNAFQWCQTIGRIVGASKLKQDLPHFGDDSCDELRDYLVVVDPNKEQSAIPAVDRFKKLVTLHLRQRSDVPSFVIGSPPSHRRHQSERPAPPPPPTMSLPRPSVVRRVTSLGDALKGSGAATGGATKPALKSGHIRRASSVGETVSGALDLTSPSEAIRIAGPAAEDAPDASLDNGAKTLL
ncbi:hypothetical protein MHU86_24027 [Fragilaria crotonensis]|nr:hypothetical protein MHU86_24027 [Fragilaria crotonensis]